MFKSWTSGTFSARFFEENGDIEVVQNEDRISSVTVYFGLIGANSGVIVNSEHDDIL